MITGYPGGMAQMLASIIDAAQAAVRARPNDDVIATPALKTQNYVNRSIAIDNGHVSVNDFT
jgi:hypothetical protein